MIKLLIVDDEEEVRQGIRYTIDWEANGIEICGEASNGTEAIRKINELLPDILIIDIRMPVKNGLEVIESVSALRLPIKSIVLSGYDDFSYAQKSLKYGASDYLLKPCRPEEILNTVLKVKHTVESENARKKVLEKLTIHFNESLNILKEKYLAKLIGFDKKYPDSLSEDFRDLRINLECQNFIVAIVRIDNFSSSCDRNYNRDLELMKFAIRNITEETLQKDFKCEVFENNDDLVIIANLNDAECKANFISLLEHTEKNINKFLSLNVSIGIGRQYNSVGKINTSYNEALRSIDAAFFSGPGSVIDYTEVYSCLKNEVCYPIMDEKEILTCIKSSNENRLKSVIDDFFNTVNAGNLSKDYLLKSCISLSLSLYHLCIELGLDVNNTFGSGFAFIDEIQKLNSLEQLKDELYRISKSIIDELNSKKSGNKLIDLALEYINENYNNDLGLETVANSIYITPGYLSMLFKQSVGINFVDYLHKIRVEKACESLKDVRLKIYEVAFKVGYSDEKYFTQLFKKHTGMTPTQYRETIVS